MTFSRGRCLVVKALQVVILATALSLVIGAAGLSQWLFVADSTGCCCFDGHYLHPARTTVTLAFVGGG